MKKGRKHTKAEVQRIISDIRTLMQEGKTDNEIRGILHLELRQFQYFSSRILTEDKALWNKISTQYLESELLKLRNSLEYLYQTAMELSKQPDYNDRIGACQAAADARLSIVQLLQEGPHTVEPLPVHTTEDKEILDVKQPHP